MIKVQRVINDPYRDWYMVYKSEVIDRVRHMPVNLRVKDSIVIVDVLPHIGEVIANGD